MTATQRELTSALRESLEVVTAAVEEILHSLDSDSDLATSPTEADVFRRSFGAVDGLAAQISQASLVVAARESHEAWERRYGDVWWPERLARLQDELRADPDVGTTSWLDSWVDALTVGAWEESARLLAEPFALAGWGVWLPDRCAAVEGAVSAALVDPERSAERLTDLVALMAPVKGVGPDPSSYSTSAPTVRDRLTDIPATKRIRLLLLVCRVLARAANPWVPDLLAEAREQLNLVPPSDEAALTRSILATESFIDRHGLTSHRRAPRWTKAMRSAAASDLGSLLEYILRSRADRLSANDPGGGADELDDEAVRDLMADAQTMVDALPDVAGASAWLAALVEVPPDELVLALVTRLARERRFAGAERLLDTVSVTSAPLRMREAELRVEIARGVNAPAEELAEALSDAADCALWGGEASLAVEHNTESLRLRPRHAETVRSLADAMQVASWGQETGVRAEMLARVLELCAEAVELEPVTSGTSWILLVERHAHAMLAGFSSGDRGHHVWGAVAGSAKAVCLAPSQDRRWFQLADDLVTAGAFFSADLVAQHLRNLTHDAPEAMGLAAVTALNLSRADEALELVDGAGGESDDEKAWGEALRGYSCRLLHRPDEAREHIAAADKLSPQLRYRQWIAEILTEGADDDAAEHWRLLWRDSDLETIEGLVVAAWAATYQRMTISCREIAARLAPLGELVACPRTSYLVRGIAAVWDSSGRDGWGDIEAAYDWTFPPLMMKQDEPFLVAMMSRAPVDDPSSLVAQLEALIETKSAEYAKTLDDRPSTPPVDVELEWLARRFEGSVVDEALPALRAAVELARASDPVIEALEDLGDLDTDFEDPAAVVDQSGDPHGVDDEGVSGDQVAADGSSAPVMVALPPSWFAELEGREETHILFRRALPDARSAERRTGIVPALDRPIRVRVEPDCEPDKVWVGASDGPTESVASVLDGHWYCPVEWLPGLSSARSTASTATALPWLLEVPAPDGVIGRLSSWSAAETVARVVLRAVRDEARPEAPRP